MIWLSNGKKNLKITVSMSSVTFTGLGEIKEIQDMYAEHLRNVWGQ